MSFKPFLHREGNMLSNFDVAAKTMRFLLFFIHFFYTLGCIKVFLEIANWVLAINGTKECLIKQRFSKINYHF